jgi:aminoglycoside N3'-acetyltransferase
MLHKKILKKILYGIYFPFRKILRKTILLPMRRLKYEPYSSNVFKSNVRSLGISEGDSVFVMCSPDKIYKRTGHRFPTHDALNDLIDIVGDEGTIMALGYSNQREQIFSGEITFSVSKTPTQCGLFSELLRRKEGAVRSTQPLYSFIALGKKAKYYCDSHDISPYAFDSNSPCYKMAKDSGKYLGLGLGVGAYSPGHMLDDIYKDNYVHKINSEPEPRKIKVILDDDDETYVYCYKRKIIKGFEAPKFHFKLLGVPSKQSIDSDGIFLFTMIMNEYLIASIDLYNRKKYTIWNCGLPIIFNIFGYKYTQIKKLIWD